MKMRQIVRKCQCTLSCLFSLCRYCSISFVLSWQATTGQFAITARNCEELYAMIMGVLTSGKLQHFISISISNDPSNGQWVR